MSQNIECTECHDLIAIEGGRVITIPFCCNSCDPENAGNGIEEVVKPVVTSQYEPSAEGEDISMEEVLGIQPERTREELQAENEQLVIYVTDIEIQLQNANQEKLMNQLRANALAQDNEFINQQNVEVNKQLAQVRQDLKIALALAARLA